MKLLRSLPAAVAVAGLAGCSGAAVTSAPHGHPVRGAAAKLAGASTGTPARGVLAANLGSSVPVAAAPTATGRGFWVASTNGAVTLEGDAQSHGDASALPLNAPMVDIASTPGGGGYWMLGGDGGVFSYGDARFFGSTGSLGLNQPALQMVATPARAGYWFVARDGGVFSYGDARFFGSTGSLHLNAPVVSMASTHDGRGYWLLGRDGGIFSYGDAHFYGSAGATRPPAPAISIVATGDGLGYWIVLANGQILAFGDAAAVPTAPIPSTGWSLVGQVVTIDPGHDGGNGAAPGIINALVPSGPGMVKACDTVGTQTASGYPEHAFNFDMALRLAADLRSRGATVVLTRTTDSGVGPCIDMRASIGNAARSDAAISIHADGGPPGGRGFTVLEPALFPGFNDSMVASSSVLGGAIRNAYVAGTPMPVSDYSGAGGIDIRSDLGGLNLSTVPKVLIECGNMINGVDAGLLENPAFRSQAAGALTNGFTTFLLAY